MNAHNRSIFVSRYDTQYSILAPRWQKKILDAKESARSPCLGVQHEYFKFF